MTFGNAYLDNVDACPRRQKLFGTLDALKVPLIAHDGLANKNCPVANVAHHNFVPPFVMRSDFDLQIRSARFHKGAAASTAA